MVASCNSCATGHFYFMSNTANLEKKAFASSQIEPFQQRTIDAVHCYSSQVCAKYSQLVANSPIGVLPQSEYLTSVDKDELAYDLLEQHLSIICYGWLKSKLKDEEFLPVTTWVHGSIKFLQDGGHKAQQIVKSVLQKFNCSKWADKLCIAFSSQVLWESDTTLSSVSTVTQSGCTSAVVGLEVDKCPLTALSQAKFDFAEISILDCSTQESVKVKDLSALAHYAKSFCQQLYASCRSNVTVDLLRKIGVDAMFVDQDIVGDLK